MTQCFTNQHWFKTQLECKRTKVAEHTGNASVLSIYRNVKMFNFIYKDIIKVHLLLKWIMIKIKKWRLHVSPQSLVYLTICSDKFDALKWISWGPTLDNKTDPSCLLTGFMHTCTCTKKKQKNFRKHKCSLIELFQEIVASYGNTRNMKRSM